MTEQAELARPDARDTAADGEPGDRRARPRLQIRIRSTKRSAAAAAAHGAFLDWRRTSVRRPRDGHSQGRRESSASAGRIRRG